VRRENGTATIENPDAWTIPVLTTPGSTRTYSSIESGSERRFTSNAVECVTKGCKRVSSPRSPSNYK
jgi:hypothetical protein